MIDKNFPSMLSSIPPLQDDEEDAWYDVEPLLTNILISTISLNKFMFIKS